MGDPVNLAAESHYTHSFFSLVFCVSVPVHSTLGAFLIIGEQLKISEPTAWQNIAKLFFFLLKILGYRFKAF